MSDGRPSTVILAAQPERTRRLWRKLKKTADTAEADDRAAWKLAMHSRMQAKARADTGHMGKEYKGAAAVVARLPEFDRAERVRVSTGLALFHVRLAALKAGKRSSLGGRQGVYSESRC